MNYGFIGVGNMAQAMLEGLHRKDMLKGHEFYLYDIDEGKKNTVAKKYNLNALNSASNVALTSDVVFLAIKPNQLHDLLVELRQPVQRKMPVLVSLPVGISMKTIEETLGYETPIIRIVANVNTEVFLSVTSFCGNDMVKEIKGHIKDNVAKLLESIGSVIELDEKYFDIFTVIASSAPAFVIKFSESLAEAALKEGLPKDIARNIIADMIHGTGKMLSVNNPTAISDRICSPGGTTIVGLTALTAGGFEAAVHRAAAECMDRLRRE